METAEIVVNNNSPFPLPIFIDLGVETDGPCEEVDPSHDVTDHVEDVVVVDGDSDECITETKIEANEDGAGAQETAREAHATQGRPGGGQAIQVNK